MADTISAVDSEALLLDAVEVGNSFSKNVIVVTGFGPFASHTINPSWEAVKKMSTLGLDKELDVRMIYLRVPVSYDIVSCIVPKLWDKYKPVLVIHCGVSSVAQELVLEQRAHNTGYVSPDINKCIPSKNCCVGETDNCIISGLDLSTVSQEVFEKDVSCVISNEAGRYLCEFIYYTSLSINRDRVAFIHVPSVISSKAIDRLAFELKTIILSIGKHILDGTSKSQKVNNTIEINNTTDVSLKSQKVNDDAVEVNNMANALAATKFLNTCDK